MILCYYDTLLLCYHVTMLPCYHVNMILSYYATVTMLSDYYENMILFLTMGATNSGKYINEIGPKSRQCRNSLLSYSDSMHFIQAPNASITTLYLSRINTNLPRTFISFFHML